MTLTAWLVAAYLVTLSGLALYGWLGLLTLWLYRRHRAEGCPRPAFTEEALPPVTVQLPLYNERYVVERLIRAVAGLRYPGERLQIQVVDDSTDETTAAAAALVDAYRAEGVDISLLHRPRREGYKAGALAAALVEARGDFIVIFDADFEPPPDFLYQTMPHFLADPDLGVVQTRWGYLNEADSALTAVQALALDKHFVVEQTVRFRANLFPKFNGTAGVWRRACLEDAGGWQADTVCEDLCLSTRAVLKGWGFRFLPQVVVPAELPTTINAYRNQQARWAKGSTQCLRKFGRAIVRCREQSALARAYALLAMNAYSTSLLLIALLLLQLPLLYLDYRFSPRMAVFSVAGLGQPLLFLASQRALYRNWHRRLRHFPLLFFTAIGLSATIGRAVLQAFLSRRHPFIRTPKRGENGVAGYRLPFDCIALVELLLALYAGLGLALALLRANFGPLFFLFACCAGFGYVFYLGVRERFPKRSSKKGF